MNEQLREAALDLAMLVLQSDAYEQPDIKIAVDDVLYLALSKP